MICGNHEHYRYDITKSHDYIKKCLGYNKNFHLLDNSVIEIGDVLFVGGTMWTNMNNEDEETCYKMKSMMNDYRVIDNGDHIFSPEDAIIKFKETVDYIDLMTSIYDITKLVVITHHAPSFKSIDPIYKNSNIMNGGYCSDLEKFIEDRNNIRVWIHGHLHNKNDYSIGDTRILCNPRGYIGHEMCADRFKLEYFEV